MDSIGIDEQEAITSVVNSEKVHLIYRPETHSMAEVKAAIEAAAVNGDRVLLGPGIFNLNINLTTGSRGMSLIGSGRNKTIIRGVTPDTPTFATKGFWFSKISGISFEHTHGSDTAPVVDIDGVVGGLGVQGCTFTDLLIIARGASDGLRSVMGLALCRTAGSSGQGDMCLFQQCHFMYASFANYFQNGYNALNNTFVGCNFMNFSKYGIYILAGSIHLFSCAFQSQAGISQIDNDGWDISADSAGVNDSLCLYGIRTESLRFIKSGVSQPPDIRNCNQGPALSEWAPFTVYPAGYAVLIGKNLYRCLISHTSGASFVLSPNWEQVLFDCVSIPYGSIRNSHFQAGKIALNIDSNNPIIEVNSDYAIPLHIKTLMVHAGSGNVAVTLPSVNDCELGKVLRIVRTDNNPTHTVTAVSFMFNNVTNLDYDQITLDRRSGIYVIAGAGGFEAKRWYIEK